MYVSKGGSGFGFCPGKATWSAVNVQMFQLLTVSAETGNMFNAGGLSDQPTWFIDSLAWFLARYNDLKFYSRARAILGDGTTKGTSAHGNKH